jgi:3-dehydroquinate synthase II
MKELWIRVDKSVSNNAKDAFLKSAAQVCDAILVNTKDVENARKTGAKIASESGDGDINVLETFDENTISKLKSAGKAVAVRITIMGKKDEEKAIKAANLSADYIIVDCPNWKIIPLENLIAKTRGRSKLLAEVSSAEDARLAIEILELGADGVVLKTSNIDELMKTSVIVKKISPKIELAPFKIVGVKQIGSGARVCVDTCDLMKPGEGILVGCQSSGFFLVEAEVHESPYVEPRPFRVNAGPAFLYTLSSLSRTKYLSELKAGDEILIVDDKGNTRLTSVGRAKIEWRPLILVEAEFGGKKIKTIVQNAETIRLVTKNGSKSVTELTVGDEVLAHTVEGGRHFGTLVKEEAVIER